MIPLSDVLAIAKEDEGYREDYLTCLYHCAEMLPPKSFIVELGTYKGYSTLALACGMPEGSRIFTIDPIFQTGMITYPNCGEHTSLTLHSSLIEVRKLWRRLDVSDEITVIPSYSWDALKYWNHGKIEFLFVDAEHTYDAVTKDCEWIQLVRKGGRVVFDDWIAEVSRAVEDYASQHPECQLVVYNNPPDYLCLSYIQK